MVALQAWLLCGALRASQLRAPPPLLLGDEPSPSALTHPAQSDVDESRARLLRAKEQVQSSRKSSLQTALAAVALATGTYAYQKANPLEPIKLLKLMETESPLLVSALASGRPSCVTFYAPWCESCKAEAPALLRLQRMYRNRVNFVVVNGDDPRNMGAVRSFGVDGIPHVALVNSGRQVTRTLVGAVPASILERAIVEVLSESKS